MYGNILEEKDGPVYLMPKRIIKEALELLSLELYMLTQVQWCF